MTVLARCILCRIAAENRYRREMQQKKYPEVEVTALHQEPDGLWALDTTGVLLWVDKPDKRACPERITEYQSLMTGESTPVNFFIRFF